MALWKAKYDVIDDVTEPDPVFNTGVKPERNLNRENGAFFVFDRVGRSSRIKIHFMLQQF